MNRHGALQVEELTGNEPNHKAMIGVEVPLVHANSTQADRSSPSAGGARMFAWSRSALIMERNFNCRDSPKVGASASGQTSAGAVRPEMQINSNDCR